jgi:hypothetical protein
MASSATRCGIGGPPTARIAPGKISTVVDAAGQAGAQG